MLAKRNMSTPSTAIRQTFVADAFRGDYKNIQNILKTKNVGDVDIKSSIKFKGKQFNGVSALWAAAIVGHSVLVDLLLDHSANVNNADDDGRSVLWAACFGSHINIVKILLDRGAIYCTEWYTPLSAACESGEFNIVKYLLEKGFSPNDRIEHGRTALHVAGFNGHTKIVKSLLVNGYR